MDHIIEIRVHGVSGTPASDMLGGPVERVPDVPGDVWRRADREDGVRAVRWSNLTSGSPVSALWLTLLPYMMLNLAGWALPSSGKWRYRLGVVTIRVTGLILTIIFTTVTAIGFLGVGGYQVLRSTVGTDWALVLGVMASLVVVLGMWVATSKAGDDAQADRVYLRSLHVAVAIWGIWWTLVVAVREAYAALDSTVLLSGGVGRAWPIPVLTAMTVVVVGLVEGSERMARPVGTVLALASSGLLIADVVGVLRAPGVGVPQPEELVTIDDPLTIIVQWFAVFALASVLLALSRPQREAGPVIGTLIALAGSTGASVGAALIWVSARSTGARPPSGIAPIAQAFLTGTLLVMVVLSVVVLRAATPGEPLLKGVYESLVKTRNGLLPVLVAVPSVTGGVLVATVASLQADGRAPSEFAMIASVAATSSALLLAGALARIGLRKAALGVLAAAVVGWLAPLTGWFDFTGVAVTVTLLIPLALVTSRIAGAISDRDKRRALAVPWDVGSFFPRRFHPFAPPSYRDRAVADLDAAIKRFQEDGFPVVIGGHSQGTVVAVAAIEETNDRDGTALLTYGSPLPSLYARFFPRHFNAELFTGVAAKLPGGWINLWRPTDPISGPLSPGPDDRRVDDPLARGHGGYWRADEKEFARAIADLEARMRPR